MHKETFAWKQRKFENESSDLQSGLPYCVVRYFFLLCLTSSADLRHTNCQTNDWLKEKKNYTTKFEAAEERKKFILTFLSHENSFILRISRRIKSLIYNYWNNNRGCDIPFAVLTRFTSITFLAFEPPFTQRASLRNLGLLQTKKINRRKKLQLSTQLIRYQVKSSLAK